MSGLIKKILLTMVFLASSINSLKCILMKSKVREAITNNEYMLYPYTINTNRCNGNCNNISNPYSRGCVPNIVKNITLRIFDLMSWKNKIKQIKWHESCKCECRLDPIICNNKQKWKINADVRVKNQLMQNVIKTLCGIPAVVSVNIREKQFIH